MLRRTLIGATAALLITGITGCGFQLRGKLDVPEHLRQVELVQSHGVNRLTNSLIQALRLNQVDITTGAPYRLVVLRASDTRRYATLDREADVDEYELNMEVEFQVTDNDGNLILPPQDLSTERVYTFDANAATAAGEQEHLLRQEMADDLARQIVMRYLRIKPAQ